MYAGESLAVMRRRSVPTLRCPLATISRTSVGLLGGVSDGIASIWWQLAQPMLMNSDRPSNTWGASVLMSFTSAWQRTQFACKYFGGRIGQSHSWYTRSNPRGAEGSYVRFQYCICETAFPLAPVTGWTYEPGIVSTGGSA